MSSAGSQGEGGPGEMELSVANATAAFEMVLSPGAGIASAAGKKETKGFLMQGASPLASPGWVGRGTGIACGKPVLSASNGALAPAGAAGTRVVKSPPPVHLYAGSVSAVGGSVQGCRGRSPRQNKLWAPPFPPGRGAGGWGQNQSQRQGRHATSKAIPRKGSCTAGRQASKK